MRTTPDIVIEGRNRFGEIRLAVLDHGPGLPPGRESEVFETFRRLEGSDRAIGGTGLGLAIVKAFAAAMGMIVEATNRPDGAGAAFVRAAFELVLAREPTPAELAASAAFLAKQAELFRGMKLTPTPGGPSADPTRRARENLLAALFNHTDFVTLR